MRNALGAYQPGDRVEDNARVGERPRRGAVVCPNAQDLVECACTHHKQTQAECKHCGGDGFLSYAARQALLDPAARVVTVHWNGAKFPMIMGSVGVKLSNVIDALADIAEIQ